MMFFKSVFCLFENENNLPFQLLFFKPRTPWVFRKLHIPPRRFQNRTSWHDNDSTRGLETENKLSCDTCISLSSCWARKCIKQYWSNSFKHHLYYSIFINLLYPRLPPVDYFLDMVEVLLLSGALLRQNLTVSQNDENK